MSCLHCSIARHPAGSRIPRGDVVRPLRDDRPTTRSSELRRLWDDAMARTAPRAQLPLQRYLTVLAAAK